MIYLLLSGISAYLGITVGLGASTLLRPLLDAVTGYSPQTVSMLCTSAALCAALISAFFALNNPLPLHQDELLLLAVGGLIGGSAGDLLSARFMSVLPLNGVVLLQNALLFTLIALPALYFSTLSHTITPFYLPRSAALPTALLLGLLASFLSFGAEPLTIAVYYLLFDAEDHEASGAALTVSVTAMASKLITLLIRRRLYLPDSSVLLWLLPGAIIGTLAALVLSASSKRTAITSLILRMSLFTSLLNIASALA